MGCILLIKFVSSTFDFKISGNAEEIVISETGLFLSEWGHAWIRSEPTVMTSPARTGTAPASRVQVIERLSLQTPPGETAYSCLYGEAPPERGTFFRLLMSPNRSNRGETAIHGCHCRGDMVVRMRKVMAIRLWYVCFSPNIDIASGSCSGIWNTGRNFLVMSWR